MIAKLALIGVALAVLVAPVSASATASASAPAGATVSGQSCLPNTGVTVEVDFLKAGATATDPAQNRIVLGCALGQQQDGFAALANAGFTDTQVPREAGAICQIDALPAQGYPYCWFTGGTWAYWRSNGTQPWTYSTLGAASVPPIPVNSAEGWAFTMLSDPQQGTQPRIAVADLASYRTVTVAKPTITGSPVPGATSPTGAAITYQWLRNGTAVAGAAGTHATYTVKTADVGASLAVTTYAASPNLTTGSATSAAVTGVLDSAVITPAYPAAFSHKTTTSVTVKIGAGVSGVAPTGKVVLHVGTRNLTATIASGAATFTVPKLAAGSYAVSVTYNGSTRYASTTTSTVSIKSV